MSVTAYNLLTEEWIPVVGVAGERRRTGLEGALVDSHKIAALDFDNPLVEAVVTRMLVALVFRTQNAPLGEPAGAVMWQEWAAGLVTSGSLNSSMTADYLNAWKDRFFLIHPTYPFCQDAAIADECSKSSGTNKLQLDIASGSNPLFWTKVPDVDTQPLDFATAAAALLVQWGYGCGGRCTARNGIADSKQSLLRGCTIFQLEGTSLFETLLLNAVTQRADDEASSTDMCSWEAEPGYSRGYGPLTRLTGSRRGLLLVSDGNTVTDAYVTWGAALPDALMLSDPQVCLRVPDAKKKPDDRTLLRYTLGQAVWADSPSILSTAIAARLDGSVSTPAGRYELVPPTLLDMRVHPLAHSGALGRNLISEASVTATTHSNDKSKDFLSSKVALHLSADLASKEAAPIRREIRKYCYGATRLVAGLENGLRHAYGEPDRMGALGADASRARVSDWIAQAWQLAGQGFAGTTRQLHADATLRGVYKDYLVALIDDVHDVFAEATSNFDDSDARRIRRVLAGEHRLWKATTSLRKDYIL